jgi:hypothetical protein
MARDGRFVVVWVSEVGQLIKARTFEADGTPIIDVFDVSDKTIGLYERPVDVAMADDGDFVVVWDSDDSTDPSADVYDILARRFAIDGTPQTAEFQVNSHATDIQKHPRVAINYTGGKYAVVWESNGFAGGDQSLYSVVARAYANDVAQGPDFQVNQTTSGNQRDPSIDFAHDNTLHFAIAWESEVSGGDYGIFSRRYFSGGTPDGDELRLDAWPYGFWVQQGDPAVGLTAQLTIVAAWQSYATRNGDDPDRCIEGRQHWSNDSYSEEFQVNTETAEYQDDADLAVNDRGDYVVVWWDINGVWARRFHAGPVIFNDGFESGDFSGWSASAP